MAAIRKQKNDHKEEGRGEPKRGMDGEEEEANEELEGNE